MALIQCPECAKEVSNQAPACPSCGYPISETGKADSTGVTQIIPTKSRSIAILLALFLGCIGIHKFYLNKPGRGFLYLLFSWTGIPLIIAWIEAIIYMFTDDDTFQEKYAG